MADRINKEIVTSKGVTSEAYVRISKYEIDKAGDASFKIEVFLNQESSTTVDGGLFNPVSATIADIGPYVVVPLKKTIKVSVPNKRTEVVDVPEEIDEDGNVIKMATKEYVEIEGEDLVDRTVPDLTPVENGTVFEFGYAKLRDVLVSLYGEENIEIV
jgi:hypothetical protein